VVRALQLEDLGMGYAPRDVPVPGRVARTAYEQRARGCGVQSCDDARLAEERRQPHCRQTFVGDDSGRSRGHRLADDGPACVRRVLERGPGPRLHPLDPVVFLPELVPDLEHAPAVALRGLAGEPEEGREREVVRTGKQHEHMVGIALVEAALADAEIDAVHV